jgi:hypothetical protein
VDPSPGYRYSASPGGPDHSEIRTKPTRAVDGSPRAREQYGRKWKGSSPPHEPAPGDHRPVRRDQPATDPRRSGHHSDHPPTATTYGDKNLYNARCALSPQMAERTATEPRTPPTGVDTPSVRTTEAVSRWMRSARAGCRVGELLSGLVQDEMVDLVEQAAVTSAILVHLS